MRARRSRRLGAQQAPAPVPASAATATPDPAPRTVRIEAIVADQHGRPITDLRPDRFRHYRQWRGTEARSRRAAIECTAASRSARTDNRYQGRWDEERAAREPGTRVIGLYLDEFHVSAGENTDRVRRAVSRFIDEQVRPNDLLVVMKPLDHLTDIRFTRDRDEARKAVEQLQWTPRRLHAAHAFRGTVPRSIARCRSCRARADCLVRTARAFHQDGGSQRRPWRHRAGE